MATISTDMTTTSVIQRVGDKIRHGLAIKWILDRLADLGVQITFYYLFKEDADSGGPPLDEAQFAGFRVARLGAPDMKRISAIADRGCDEQVYLDRLSAGDACFGLWEGDQLAAFTWCHFQAIKTFGISMKLADDEAYLYDAYTYKDWRGRAVQPWLRSHSHRALAAMGRKSFFSITEYFNRPALRFKKKIGARRIRLGIFIRLFGRLFWGATLRDYGPAGIPLK